MWGAFGANPARQAYIFRPPPRIYHGQQSEFSERRVGLTLRYGI